MPTPLLLLEQQPQAKKTTITPLPWSQLSVLLILQIAEPLTIYAINPFAPDLIRHIGITGGDEAKVGYYVGLMQSIFSLTQASTVLLWSRISDHVGRKPVIMTGLLGLSLSMYCFGLSTTFWGLVLSRCLNGALNGNVGVLKSMMAEITDSTNIAKAYSYLPISWLLGSTLGPLIGGSLSRPQEQFPNLFGQSNFMKKYPYFLACAVPGTFAAIASLMTLFLKETVTHTSSISRLKSRKNTTIAVDQDADANAEFSCHPVRAAGRPLPLKDLLVPRVLISAGNYALLAVVDISYRAVQPLYMSTPILLGGLGMSPKTIGAILAVYGICNGILQIMFFARLTDRYGAKMIYLSGIACLMPIFVLFPIMNLLARSQGVGSAYTSVPVNFCYGSIFVYITASSPNKASLGSVNGMAQTTVSIMRAVGPAVANSLFSLSIDSNHHYMGGLFVYLVLCCLVCCALYGGSLLPAKVWDDTVVER
ncbi:MFS general substrate transporter [Amylocystis lapponica]|nr:MFS general substrate transporter [Amylocystis lapponica]